MIGVAAKASSWCPDCYRELETGFRSHENKSTLLLPTLLLCLASAAGLLAQNPAFTFQGRLDENGMPATGAYDFVFTLHDSVSGGIQAGPSLTNNTVL